MEPLFHPANPDGTEIQRAMTQALRQWVDKQGDSLLEVITRLNKENVKHHRNVRLHDNHEKHTEHVKHRVGLSANPFSRLMGSAVEKHDH